MAKRTRSRSAGRRQSAGNQSPEEAEELRTADPGARLEEAADVYEVLLAIAQTLEVDMATVAATADAKRAERGGFERRLWLET